MADAAYAANIPPGFQVAAGYFPGRADYHPWAPADWGRFPGFRLPITVPADPGDGPADGAAAVAYLRDVLHVPEGCFTVVDMEGRVDAEYLLNYGEAVQPFYRVWVYGSASSVFGNPPLNGYWVADYTQAVTQKILDLLEQPHVRAVQYATGPGYDSSLVKDWTEGGMWHG